MVKSDRPNPNLETFRNGQLRAVAAGSRLSFSSAARNYNGTYSAQRQELVESTDGYLILQDCFIGAVAGVPDMAEYGGCGRSAENSGGCGDEDAI
ncbi:phage portal protein [Escherichia coli]